MHPCMRNYCRQSGLPNDDSYVTAEAHSSGFKMSVVMSSISHSTVDSNIQRFDHEGLRWVQKTITVLYCT